MPSLVMYLAVAKKYMEKHSEENEEEFIEGILAPDRRINLTSEKAKLHYGEKTSHRPDLNRYYHEQGLESSYNRGYFLNLITDYLFYNKYLQEYSADIYDDYKKMNSRIIDKYNLSIPEDIENQVDIVDGEIKVINENEVYKFIETVGQLDLEQYKEQIKETDKEHQIKLIGLKEGLLFKQIGATTLNQHSETYLYGYENNYGVLIKRKIGFSETKGAKEGLYQVTPIGIAVKPSKIGEFDAGDIAKIRETLTDEEINIALKMCEDKIGKSIDTDLDDNFERINKNDVQIILSAIKKLPQRKPKKEITDYSLNLDLVEQEDIEIE